MCYIYRMFKILQVPPQILIYTHTHTKTKTKDCEAQLHHETKLNSILRRGI